MNRGLKLSIPATGALLRGGSVGGHARSRDLATASGFLGKSLFFLPPLEHLGDRLFDGLSRVIQEEGVFRCFERGDGAIGIACVAGLEVGQKTRECSRNPF